jgi:hypothetical protein
MRRVDIRNPILIFDMGHPSLSPECRHGNSLPLRGKSTAKKGLTETALRIIPFWDYLRISDHGSAPMASRGRKLGKSVHSAAQRLLCDLMIEARRRAGLTQQALADRLSKPQSFIDVVEFIAICRAIPADSASILAKVAKLA